MGKYLAVSYNCIIFISDLKLKTMEKLFTIADLRVAFIAGEEFESDVINLDMGEVDELTKPDFGEWVKENFNIDVD